MQITIDIDETEIAAMVKQKAVEEAVGELTERLGKPYYEGRIFRELLKEVLKVSVERNEAKLFKIACEYAGEKIVRDGRKAGLLSLRDILEAGDKDDQR